MTESKPTTRTILRRLGLFAIVGFVLMIAAFFAMEYWRAEAAKMSSSNNMRQLYFAHANYSDAMGKFPGPFVDFNLGEKLFELNPDESKRLSWRVAVLPYVESTDINNRIAFNEPWDSPTNAPFAKWTYKPYVDPLDLPHPDSRYRVFYDGGALFDTDPKKRVGIDKIPDGTANTILVVESREAVPWSQFNEHKYDPNGPLPELGHPSRKKSGFFVGMADGSVKFVRPSISPEAVKAAITKAGGETIGLD